MAYLLLDEMLSDYNRNKQSGKPALDRNEFGRLLWPERNESNFKSTLSLWSNKLSPAMPSLSCAGKICKIIGVDYNTFIQNYVK